MEKKIRKIGLLCTTAVMACSLVLGAGITAFPKSVSAETASMASIIGKKTDNVTVTAEHTITLDGALNEDGEEATLTGLLIDSEDQHDWSAELDTTFTGKNTISYYLSKYTKNGAAAQFNATAFSVINSAGETVAVYVHTDGSYGIPWNNFYTGAYVYNPKTDTYTRANTKWSSQISADYVVNDTPQTLSYGSCSRNPALKGFSEYMYFAPHIGTDWMNYQGKVGVSTLDYVYDGTLTFDYADGVLKIGTSSYKMKENTSELAATFGGLDNIIVGVVETNLDDGYRIVMSDAPTITNAEGTTYQYPASSSVLITAINSFATRAENVELGERQGGTISYVGEKVVDEKNVITLDYGEKLNKFDVYNAATATDIDNVTLALNGYMESFDYEGNKVFTADEEITVTNGTLSKTYLVDVIMPTIDTTKLLTALTDVTDIRAASAPKYNNYETNATYGDSTNAAYDPYSVYGTALVIGGHTSTNNTIGAKLNGMLYGNTSITYLMRKNTHKAANAIMLEDAQGNKVLHVMNFTGGYNTSKAFLYDYATQKFYAPNSSTYAVQEITTYAEAKASGRVAPSYFQWANAYDYATLSFHYDDEAKKVTVSTTRVNDERTVVTLGEVSVDLSKGYTVSFITPNQLTEGYFTQIQETWDSAAADMNTWTSPAVIITEINGVDVTGAKAEATGRTKGVVCDNGAEVAMGEELTFTSNSVYNFGSLAYKGSSEVTVDTAADVSKPGETVAIVSDWLGTYEIPLTVKTLSQSLTGVEMENGAFIRVGQGDTDRGLGFRMNVSAADKALLEAYVGEGKAYASVSYGMIIMPYSYVTDAGVTEETLFGENALYTWKDKQGAGSVEVLQMETSYLRTQEELHYVFGAITELKKDNIKKDFIGVGYVKLTDADGNVEYVVASAYSDTSADANNNIRSAYEVAQAAVDSGKYDSIAEWLRTNYLAE